MSVLHRHEKTVAEIVKCQKKWGLAEWSQPEGEMGNYHEENE